MVGAILLLASVFRLGFVASFISAPVLVGFKAGIGLVIVLDQVPKILGVHIAKGSFLHNVVAIARGLPDVSPTTVAVGITMIAVLVGFKRFLPRAPAPLVAVAAGILGRASTRASVTWCGVSRPDSCRAAAPNNSRILPCPRTMAGGAGHRAHGSFTETVLPQAEPSSRARSQPPEPTKNCWLAGFANAGGSIPGINACRWWHTSQTAVNRLAEWPQRSLRNWSLPLASLATMLFLAPLSSASCRKPRSRL